MVVFNEAYFRIPIIGYFSFVCAEKHTKSFAVDIFFSTLPLTIFRLRTILLSNRVLPLRDR